MHTAETGRILVVDDEVDLARLIEGYLRKAGLDVAVRSFDPDVLVLDLGLSGIDGTEVCRQVRTLSDCHVLMLTARDDEIDKIIGLSVGADDYVTKPFSPRELVARVQAMLRRSRTSNAEVSAGTESRGQALVIEDLVVDQAARRVQPGDELVALTRSEFDLLTWWPLTRTRCCPGRSCWSWAGTHAGPAMIIWWMCTSGESARS